AQDASDIRNEQQSLQQQAQDSQTTVADLDDETMSLVSAYNRELARYEELQTYNDNMRQLLASQEQERARINGELQEVEVVRQAIVPLMVEMVDVLGEFIALDQPMLMDERNARLAQLQSIITRSDVELAEKYRRIIEAYQIEAEYGQSLEAYEADIEIAGSERTVDILRVGRVALYYISLDREQAGIWDPDSRSWHVLPGNTLDSLDFALRVAREQAPPNLMALPLWTQGGSQ
ncbi:MAG: DUF3450 domain-containing protein, partial [Pseudohongiellaceae bacterium]